MGDAPRAVTFQVLARGQTDRAVDPEGMTYLAQHHLGVAASIEIPANAAEEFIRDARA